MNICFVLIKVDKKVFVEFLYCFYVNDFNWVLLLKDEVYGLLILGKNLWFEYGEV